MRSRAPAQRRGRHPGPILAVALKRQPGAAAHRYHAPSARAVAAAGDYWGCCAEGWKVSIAVGVSAAAAHRYHAPSARAVAEAGDDRGCCAQGWKLDLAWGVSEAEATGGPGL